MTSAASPLLAAANPQALALSGGFFQESRERFARSALSHIAQNALAGCLIIGSATSLGVWGSDHKILVISSAVLGGSLQRLVDLNVARPYRHLATDVKTHLAYLYFVSIWQVWLSVSTPGAYLHNRTAEAWLRRPMLGSLVAYGVSCWYEELRLFVDYFNRDICQAPSTRQAEKLGPPVNSTFLPSPSSPRRFYLILGSAGSAFAILTALSFRFSTHLKMAQPLALLGLAVSVGAGLQGGWMALKRRLQKRAEAPPANETPSSTSTSQRAIDLCLRFASTAASGVALAAGHSAGIAVAGTIQGSEEVRRQQKFEQLTPSDYIAPADQHNPEFLARHPNVKVKAQATKITQVTVYLFLLSAVSFFLIAGVADTENSAKIWGTVMTILPTLLGSYLFYKMVERHWKPGENGQLVNTCRFLLRHYFDLFPFLAFAISSLVDPSNQGINHSSSAQYVWEEIDWVLWASLAGTECGRITDINRESPARLTSIATLYYALTMTKLFQGKL